jgi:site-specific DNA-methyltransferase (adenine-specific)
MTQPNDTRAAFLRFASDKQTSCLHLTQKPVALMEYLVKTYSNVGDTILDPTMGSGTVKVVCDRLNRNFIGIENNEAYFKIAQERKA